MKEEKETPATNLICIAYKFKKMFYVSYIPSIYWKGGYGALPVFICLRQFGLGTKLVRRHKVNNGTDVEFINNVNVSTRSAFLYKPVPANSTLLLLPAF